MMDTRVKPAYDAVFVLMPYPHRRNDMHVRRDHGRIAAA
jgi:hypothetical protein